MSHDTSVRAYKLLHVLGSGMDGKIFVYVSSFKK